MILSTPAGSACDKRLENWRVSGLPFGTWLAPFSLNAWTVTTALGELGHHHGRIFAYRHMKHLIIGLLIMFAVYQLTEIIWSSKGHQQNETLARLIEAPPHYLLDPNQNGYLFLLGFAAAGTLDPAKVGHDIWLENHIASNGSGFNYDKPGRSDLRLAVSPDQMFPTWHADDPLKAFRTEDVRARITAGHNQIFLTRYQRWLTMKFEDWGFGRSGLARVDEILLAHRLYLADGFSRQTALGAERLQKDLLAWRLILRHAATIATKVTAQIAIADDLFLVSALLSQSTVNKTLLTMLPPIVSPLTADEYALRWPMQHQFTLDIHGARSSTLPSPLQSDGSDTHRPWFVRTAHLPDYAFDRIEHPAARSFLGIPLYSRHTWDPYASYYDALIRASMLKHDSLPMSREMPHVTSWDPLDKFFNPIPFEPDWEPFRHQLVETDARLRLASLQLVLRRPSPQHAIPTRLAEVGSAYYDPFTGLPMLWSPTQHKIYSVGKDRLDDGGDTSFDISVPAVVSVTASARGR